MNGKEKERLWGLRALALAIAVGIWLGVSWSQRDANAVAEKVLEATMSYINKPRDVILVDQVPTARVTVSGPDRQIQILAPYMVQVQVDLAGRTPGVASIPLGAANVRLPTGLEVVSIEPTLLNLEIDREVTRTLPLRVQFTGEPAAGARVLFDQITIEPPQAIVSGPAKLVEVLESLNLSRINLDTHAITFDERATVVSPDPLVRIIQNPQAMIHVPMDLGTGTVGGEAVGGQGDSL